jgi:hypothetical protein
MSKQPNIAFPRGVEVVEGKTANGVLYKFKIGRKDDFLEIDGASITPDLRAALLARGGREMVKQTWYVRLDCSMLLIPQWDGTTHTHRPLGEDHEVTCNSPACQQFFADDWRRAHPIARLGGAPLPRAAISNVGPEEYYLPIAAPVKEQRPKNAIEWEAEVRQTADTRAAKVQGEAMGRAFAETLQAAGVYQPTEHKR